MSDNEQESFGNQNDVMQTKETIELVRTYYSIQDQAKRKEILRFIKSMTDISAD